MGYVLNTPDDQRAMLEQIGVDMMLANRVEMGSSIQPPRFRWVPYADALIFPLVLKRIYDDKDVQEQMIRASGLEWTIVRPGLLTIGPATGQARALIDPGEWRAGSVSRVDVAEFLVREAFERRFVGKTPLVIR